MLVLLVLLLLLFVCCFDYADAAAPAGAADLVPAKVKLYIFYGMPKKTKLKTIFAPLCGQSPEQVMAPAVADSHKLGYDKLYRLLLDHVSIAFTLLPLTLASLCLSTTPFLCICCFVSDDFHNDLMYDHQ